MSYILESLKKSEQERRDKEVDSPIEQVYDSTLLDDSDNSVHSNKRYAMIIGAVLLLVLLVGGIFAIIITHKVADPVQVIANDNQNTINYSDIEAKKKAFDQSLSEKKEVKKIDVDNLYRQLEQEKQLHEQQKIQQLANQQKESLPQIQQEQESPAVLAEEASNKVNHQDSLSESSSQPLVNNHNADDKVANADTHTPQVASTQEPLIPYFNSLSLLSKANIPSINYSAHIYAEDNRSGFVVINGKKQRAGSKLANGIFLEKIEEDAIVLSLDGLVFKMPAMTSWINR